MKCASECDPKKGKSHIACDLQLEIELNHNTHCQFYSLINAAENKRKYILEGDSQGQNFRYY